MIKIELKDFSKEIDRVLNQIPIELQAASFDSGLPKATVPVKKRLRELTPRSSRTGSTKKWSKKTAAARSGQLPLWKTVRHKVVRYKGGKSVAIVGYKWPDGNKGNFTVPSKTDQRKVFLWGKETGRSIRRGDDILKRAFDETKEAAGRAFVAGVTSAVKRKLAGLTNG